MTDLAATALAIYEREDREAEEVEVDSNDLYGILCLDKMASDHDIRQAYRKLALKWHPDKNESNKQVAVQRFKEICQAYEVLSNPEKREIFDHYGLDAVKHGIGKKKPAGHNHGCGGCNCGMSDPNDVFSKVFAEHGEMLENCEEIIILGTSATTEKRNQLQKKYPNSSALVSVRNGQNDNSEPSVEQLSDTVAVVDLGNEDEDEFIDRPDISVRYEKGKSISESTKIVDGKERKTKFTLYDNGEQLLEITEEGKLISRQVNGFETVQYLAIEGGETKAKKLTKKPQKKKK